MGGTYLLNCLLVGGGVTRGLQVTAQNRAATDSLVVGRSVSYTFVALLSRSVLIYLAGAQSRMNTHRIDEGFRKQSVREMVWSAEARPEIWHPSQ